MRQFPYLIHFIQLMRHTQSPFGCGAALKTTDFVESITLCNYQQLGTTLHCGAVRIAHPYDTKCIQPILGTITALGTPEL